MELREALAVLGVERVRRGMRAIDEPYDTWGDPDERCERCFLGRAFGNAANVPKDLRAAAQVVEAWFEGWYFKVDMPEPLRTETRDSWGEGCDYGGPARRALRAECIAFLAEHGEAPEPSPVPSLGIPAFSVSVLSEGK